MAVSLEPSEVRQPAAPVADRSSGPGIRRFWWLMVLTALVGGAAGAALALRQPPTYESEVRLTVADVDLETRSVPGFVEAAQSLASSYSQAVTSRAVLAPIARRHGTTTGDLAARVTATPIPESTLFVLRVRAPDRREAVALANEIAEAEQRYVGALDSSDRQAELALSAYRVAMRTSAEQQDEIDRLTLNGAPATPAEQQQLMTARSRKATADLRAEAASVHYQLLRGGTASQSARKVTMLGPATNARSDLETLLQRFVTVGVAGGFFAGLLLALALERRRRGARW